MVVDLHTLVGDAQVPCLKIAYREHDLLVSTGQASPLQRKVERCTADLAADHIGHGLKVRMLSRTIAGVLT
jgi:hypothetical protein